MLILFFICELTHILLLSFFSYMRLTHVHTCETYSHINYVRPIHIFLTLSILSMRVSHTSPISRPAPRSQFDPWFATLILFLQLLASTCYLRRDIALPWSNIILLRSYLLRCLLLHRITLYSHTKVIYSSYFHLSGGHVIFIHYGHGGYQIKQIKCFLIINKLS